MWFFRRQQKDPQAVARHQLLALLERWREFDSEELDSPHLEKKLQTLSQQLEQEYETNRQLLRSAGEQATRADIEFLFQVLLRLPIPPANFDRAPTPTSPQFSWETAERELGSIARKVNLIRVAVQQQIRSGYSKEFQALERRASNPANAQQQLAALREAERAELNRVDDNFRGYLARLMHLYQLYETALNALAHTPGEEGLRELITGLRSDDHAIRNLSLAALKLRNYLPTTTAERLDFYIVPALSPETQDAAFKKISQLIQETSDVAELLEVIEPRLCEKGLTELQGVLLEHLCSLHSEKALDRLAQVISSSLEAPALKAKAVDALADIGTPRAVEVLIQAMDELDMEVRAAAAAALGKWARQSGTRSELHAVPSDGGQIPSVRSAAMERLIFALRDGDIPVRENAAAALRYFPEAADRLYATMLQERNPNAREYAARALENFPSSPAGTDALLQALRDENAAVRKAAADALTKQGWTRPPPPDANSLAYLCARQNWRELNRIGKPAIPALLTVIRDRDETIRLAVVQLLGAIRAKEAVKELCLSLSDSNQDVRREAAIALRLINDPQALPALRSALAKEGFKEVKTEIQAAIDKLVRKQ